MNQINQDMQHHAVVHRNSLLEELKQDKNKFYRWNNCFADWVSQHILPSLIMFDSAFILPLLVLPMPDWTKLLLAVISSNWIQWWALPALQRSQNKIQMNQDAKAEVDHQALVYISKLQDRQMQELELQSQILKEIHEIKLNNNK